MKIVHTTVFRTNKTQAVRLPKAIALPDSVREVDIIAVGNTRIITPAGESWDQWFSNPKVTDDFMIGRDQEPDQQREPL